MRSAAWLDEFAHRIPELPRATVNMNPLDHGGTPPPQDVRPPETSLLVEDDAAAAARLLHLLARVYPRTEVQHAPELASARRILRCTVIDLALVDIHLPDGSGLELLYDIQSTQPQATSVVISAWGHTETIVAAIRSGARGYLLKNVGDEEIERGLSSIKHGGAPIDPLVANRILALLRSDQLRGDLHGTTPEPGMTDRQLSPRQFEILKRVAHGNTNREIALALGLSAHTVECHTRSIYRKLAVHTRTEAAMVARNKGWL